MMRSMPRSRVARPFLPLVLACAVLLAGAGTANGGADAFDPTRCLGRWHVVARTEAAAEQDDCRASEFLRSAEGLWAERCVDPDGPERLLEVDREDPRHWDVASGVLTRRELHFIYVSPDARFAAIGGDGPRVLTLLAREAAIPAWHYTGLVARAALQGYDVAALKKEGPARSRP